MGKITIGVAIGRRKAQLVAVGGDSRTPTLLFERELTRPQDTPPSRILKDLLAELPERIRTQPLALALSSGDLACDDLWPAPEGFRPREIADVAPVLLEARATGESLEDLAIDVRLGDGNLSAVALSTAELAALRRTVLEKGGRLVLVTSLPAVLAHYVPGPASLGLCWAGQRTWVSRQGGALTWGSSPLEDAVERVETPDPLVSLKGGPGTILATAVALADHESVPNALRGAPDAPRTFSERHRAALRVLSVAVAYLLASIGGYFSSEERRFRSELAVVHERERADWTRHFPDRPPVRDDLLRTVRERLRESGQGGGGSAGTPSAFLFWLELGKVLPDVEALGLSLESLDITPEGGRLSASVAAVPGDVLRNAALLEARVGESPRLSARGDFEARERDVQVRLKVDCRNP